MIVDQDIIWQWCGGEQQLRVWLWGCGRCQNWDNDETPAEGIHINTGNRSGAWAAAGAAMEYHHHYLGRVAPIFSYRQHTAAGRKQVLCVTANAELQMSLADWLGLGAPFLLDI